MKTKRRVLLKNSKAFLLVSLCFIFLFLNLNSVSATASFNPIPFQTVGYQSSTFLQLNNYCVSNIAGRVCNFTSYTVQFTNPDNSTNIILFPGQSAVNSFFSVSLSNAGLLSISANSKNLTTSFIVGGADVAYSSQATKSFGLSIIQNSKPEQISSIALTTLYGNQSQSYSMNNFVANYNAISVSYNDDIRLQTVSFKVFSNGVQQCVTGQIKVCLNPTGSNVVVTIQGLNITYNSSVTGGNIFQIVAYNNYGQTFLNSFPVVVYPQTLGAVAYNFIPARNPLSLAPVVITYNETKLYDFGTIYSNYTSINLTWNSSLTSPPASSAWFFYDMQFYKNGTVIVGYSDAVSGSSTTVKTNIDDNLGDIFDNSTNGSIAVANFFNTESNVSKVFVRFIGYPILAPNGTLFPSDTAVGEINNFPVNITACNNVGCISSDGFGNKDVLYISLKDVPVTATPFQFAPIQMGFNEVKNFDVNKMFQNFRNLTIYVNESAGSGNITLTQPGISYNNAFYIENGEIIYELRLYSNSIVSVLSTDVSHDVDLGFQACNAGSMCLNGSEFQGVTIPHTLRFEIFNYSGETFSDVQVSSGAWGAIYNTFFGMFPDPDTLTSKQKSAIVVIFLFIVTIIIMYLGYSTKNIVPALWVAGLVDFFIFIFFVFKGYISLLIIVMLVVVVVLIALIKFMGGKGNE